jgi:hypothetical protein
MYARGTDGAIYRQGFSAAFWQFYGERLGGFAKGEPAVVSQNPNQLMVFVRGSDDQLYVNQLTGSSWSGWIALGGTLTADPTAAAHGWNGQYVTVVVRGAGGEPNYRRWNGYYWEDWNTLGGWVTGRLSAVPWDVARSWCSGAAAATSPTSTSSTATRSPVGATSAVAWAPTRWRRSTRSCATTNSCTTSG